MKKLFKSTMLFVIPAMLSVTATQAQTVTENKQPGINLNFMDQKVKPSTDFF
jgi:endothelin-converting enzyme/putative endopeptidase